MKKQSIKRNLLLPIILIAFLLVIVIVSIKQYYLSDSSTQSHIPSPTATPPTITPTPTAQPILSTPTPTTPTYEYILWKSHDEIHLTIPAKAGYAIAATLRDEKFNIVTNQAGFTYTWAIDDKTLLKDDAQSFSACTQGIQEPCPQDHFTFVAAKAGTTVIRVEVSKDQKVVAATTFPLIIEETK